MKQVVFVLEILSDGEKNSYAVRLTNGQLVACAFDADGFYQKLDGLLSDFDKITDNSSSSVKAPDKE